MDDKEFEQLVAMFTPMLGEAGARELAQSMKDSGVTGIDFSQLGQQFSPDRWLQPKPKWLVLCR